MLTRDHVMRMVKQLAGALARVMGLRKAGRPDEAMALLDDAQRDALGSASDLVARVDDGTAARLLGGRETVLAYAEILALRGEILVDTGREGAARAAFARALFMALEARALGAPADERLRSVVARARVHADEGALAPRHADALASLG